MKMERMGVCNFVLVLMFILCSLFSMMLTVTDSATTSTTTMSVSKNTKYHYYLDRLRRNLLANGLGSTPPMGYCLFNYLSLLTLP